MKRFNFGLIAVLIIAIASIFTMESCKKGANQPPVSKYILIQNAFYNTAIYQSWPAEYVKTAWECKTLTADNNNQTVVYDQNSGGDDPTLPNNISVDKWEFPLQLPQQYSGYGIRVILRSLECGWPYVGGGNPTNGGKEVLEFISPIYTSPQNISVLKSYFTQLFTDDC